MGGEREHQETDFLACPASPPTRSFAPVPEADADRDFEEWAAWADRELAAGRDPFPPERVLAQGTSISIGDAEGIDPELLAALSGPGCVSGGLGPQFSQGAAADLLQDGVVMSANSLVIDTDAKASRVYGLEYRGSKRYIRLVLTETGAIVIPVHVLGLLSRPTYAPVGSPIQGTAAT